jgi:hypothetical protein
VFGAGLPPQPDITPPITIASARQTANHIPRFVNFRFLKAHGNIAIGNSRRPEAVPVNVSVNTAVTLYVPFGVEAAVAIVRTPVVEE